MKDTKTEDPLQVFARIIQSALTASYLGAYRYYTLEPIEIIERDQEKIPSGELQRALVDFRQVKEEELSFVSKAVGQDLQYPVDPQTIEDSLAQLVLYRLPYLEQRSLVSSRGRAPRRPCGLPKCSGTGVSSCPPSRSSARLPRACSSTCLLKTARNSRRTKSRGP